MGGAPVVTDRDPAVAGLLRPMLQEVNVVSAPTLAKDQIVVINLSGRGDKDCVEVARLLGKQIG